MIRYSKRALSIALTLLLLCCLTPALAEEAEGRNGPAFSPDGTFTLLVLSDLMDTQYTSPYLLRALKNVLQETRVDLAVLLGNQLDGTNPLLRLGSAQRNVDTAIGNLLEPLLEQNVPFALVFGDGDYAAPVSVDQQLARYRAEPLCLTPDAAGDGAYCLSVYGSDRARPVMNLYLFNGGRDGSATQEQVDWFSAASADFRAENGGTALPSVAFMHTVMPEVYGLFPSAAQGSPEAAAGNGPEKDAYYRFSSDRIFTGSVGEAPNPSVLNSGLFDALVLDDSVFLCVSGSDHLNSFIGSLKGMDLASVPGATYIGYGSAAARGVRLFRFYEETVTSYDTLLVPFSDYDGTPAGIPALHYYLSTTTRIPAWIKAVVAGALLLGGMAVLLILIIRQNKEPEPFSDIQENPPEDPYL